MLEGQFKRSRRRNVFTLASDPDFLERYVQSEDAEFSWAECVDQSQLRSSHEDEENDDPDTGIDDCCCDAREEDGI